MVNLTLTDACPVEIHPDKTKLAREAQRLAKELQDEADAKDTDWISQLEALSKDAEECLQRVQEEVQNYERELADARAKASSSVDDGMQELQMTQLGSQEGDGDNLSMSLTDEAEIVPWQLEGAIKAAFPSDSEYSMEREPDQKPKADEEPSGPEEGSR